MKNFLIGATLSIAVAAVIKRVANNKPAKTKNPAGIETTVDSTGTKIFMLKPDGKKEFFSEIKSEAQ